jgi:myo-inositol-1(or 4)-monophosphatase
MGDGEQPLRATDASLTIAIGDQISAAERARVAECARAAILADRWFVRMLGTTLGFAYVATGRLSAYLQFRASSPVHTAAGCLIAEEAGAAVTDLDGRPWDLDTRSFLAAATPELHHELLTMAGETRDSST